MLYSGMKVVVSEYAVTKEWVYPKERFWSYTPSPETERWCRFFGYGHEETRPAAIQMHDMWIVHPAVYEQIKKISESCDKMADLQGHRKHYSDLSFVNWS